MNYVEEIPSWPQKREKEESEWLRREGDKIKFIDLRYEIEEKQVKPDKSSLIARLSYAG